MHPLLIITDLRQTDSKLAKEAILRNESGNETWKDYLVKVYNPFIVYGVSGDKIGGRDDLDNLRLCRSIDAGITATTINKVYPGLLPTPTKVMKAKPATPDDVKHPLYVGVKYDGHFTCITVTAEGGYQLYTSGGHEYTLSPDAPADQVKFFESLPAGVYLAERVQGQGLLGDRKLVALEGSKRKGLQTCKPTNDFRIFDMLTFPEYEQDKSDQPFSQRLSNMYDLFGKLNAEGRMAVTLRSADPYTTRALVDNLVSQGHEGVMLIQPELQWRSSKSRKLDFVKYKQLHTADLVCVGENHGTTAATVDSIGSLTTQNAEGVEVNVSSGLTDAERNSWGSFIGKVVEIRYEHKNPDGTYVQPVFLQVREDKLINDID